MPSWSVSSVEAGLDSSVLSALWSFRGGEGAPRSYLALPDGQMDIVFAVRGGRPSLMVVGAHEQALRKPTASLDLTVTARLSPGVAPALFDVSAHALTSGAVPLAELWGDAGARLLAALVPDQPLAARNRVLRSAIAERSAARGEREAVRLARAAVGALAAAPAGVRIAALADGLGVGERRLRRVFAAAVGVDPRAFRRMLRFRRAVAASRVRSRASWAELAADAGYFDQSHLINDFKSYVGVTPERFRDELSGPDAPLLAPYTSAHRHQAR